MLLIIILILIILHFNHKYINKNEEEINNKDEIKNY
jgi:hypothetical protein